MGGTKGSYRNRRTKNEKKLKALEEEKTDEMEMAAQTNEEREEKTS